MIDKRADDLKRALAGAVATGTEVVMVDLPTGYAVLHPGVTTDDEIDAIVADMREHEAEANARTTGEQRAIGSGDYWCRLHGDYAIFGRVTPWADFVKRERELSGDEVEVTWIIDRRRDSDARGYRFGPHYSVVVPDGEPGETHVAEMMVLSEAEFNEARDRNWFLDRCVGDGLPWAVRLVAGK